MLASWEVTVKVSVPAVLASRPRSHMCVPCGREANQSVYRSARRVHTSCVMATPCGKVVNDTICVRGNRGREWPKVDAKFSYIDTNGNTRYGMQQMKYGLSTTETKHKVGHYYPIRGTNNAVKIMNIYGDRAFVRVMYHGSSECLFPKEETIPLTSLQLVTEYTSLEGVAKTQSTSVIPNISNTPSKDSPSKNSSPSRKNAIRGNPTAAIVVSTNVDDVYSHLVNISNGPVVLAMTHTQMPEGALVFREFSDMKALAENLYTQGIMDEGDQGRSCGVEAVNNAGFKVDASAFIQQAADGVDTDSFMVDDGARGRNHDDYIDNTGGGNNIPPHQIYLTLKKYVERQGMQMDSTPWHYTKELIGTPEFWKGHQWAIVQIPACGGHWVSMEKIMYMGQPAVCLREGRGTVTYDFVTSSDGVRARLPPGVTGKAVATGGKRKR